ncbi:MAG: glycoside hydrolase family 3 protein [Acidobacteria bacterium]|nr:glycoside hydrolase family 3 protein [Acidobacteriota bacterium]
MVSSPANGLDAPALNDLSALHVGNVFLKGHSSAGAATIKARVEQLNGTVTAASAGIKPFVATDQEGGAVQILAGPGFSAIPSALDQGTMAPAALQNAAHIWGAELASAGVNVNFAPVADTVPGPAAASTNPPIGVFGREYGYTPQAVAGHAAAFAAGLSSAGIVPTAKHFPNLGRVNANTDTTTAVTDSVTVRNDPAVAAFRAVIKDGKSWLMMSSAYYPQIDPDHIAPFSSLMMRNMVRGDLGFQGVIVSDDMCDARQLSPFPATERAADFIAAGGTLALCTNQSTLPALYQGLVARYQADPAFAAVVDQAALKMLQAKQASQLLPNS